MVTKKDIIEAYVFLRQYNMSLPSIVLDFIKAAALEKLETGEAALGPWTNGAIKKGGNVEYVKEKGIEIIVYN